MKLFALVGSPGFERDDDELRELAARQLGPRHRPGRPRPPARRRSSRAATASADLKHIQAPTLVIHGKSDRLVRPSGGRATARAIPGARLDLIDGMGHDLPRGVWPRILDGIEQTAARAAEPAAQPAA